MIYGLVALLVITVLATYWANRLAYQRKRHVGAWSFATAMLPPLALVLWALPAKTPD